MATGMVIDIGPRIRRKMLETCKHDSVSVSMTRQELTCDECERDIDPWVWIRGICLQAEMWAEQYEKMHAAAEADFNAKLATLNAQLKHHADEVNRLIDTKNRLNSETVNGVKLRDAKRYTRKRT
jgi:hypothetical protein